MYMQSDKCSVEQGKGRRDEQVFCTCSQKQDKNMIQTYDCKKNIKVMVQGCFWDDGRSSLYIIDRDFESKKHRYFAKSYLEVLNAKVASIYASLDLGYLFMQDNASIYTAIKVKEWFANYRINKIKDQPPYSPNLNLIEHIQQILKKRVFEMFPNIAAETSQSEYARQRLESALQAAWDTIDKSSFNVLYKSMPSRIKACIKAKGQHTKY